MKMSACICKVIGFPLLDEAGAAFPDLASEATYFHSIAKKMVAASTMAAHLHPRIGVQLCSMCYTANASCIPIDTVDGRNPAPVDR